jgi:aminoglycoside phosphotransferase (APT) family kinase protein
LHPIERSAGRLPSPGVTIGNTPAAEVHIDEHLVRALLESQHPDLAAQDLVEIAAGWDNVIFRLGSDLAVRLPRREMSAALVEHEQRWLPELAARLPMPIPAPVRVGRPALGYPWSWSVAPWLEGEIAARVPPADPYDAATRLGAFLAALHVPAPAGAPPNPFRGVPLEARAPGVATRIEQLGPLIDGDAAGRLWHELHATPPWAGPPLWLHGDLHPANVLVSGGRVAAVIDWGDITAGDPATDLSIAWMLLPAPVRSAFRAAASDVDDDTWTRAQAWALALALAYLANSADNSVIHGIGRRTLEAVLTDAPR